MKQWRLKKDLPTLINPTTLRWPNGDTLNNEAMNFREECICAEPSEGTSTCGIPYDLHFKGDRELHRYKRLAEIKKINTYLAKNRNNLVLEELPF